MLLLLVKRTMALLDLRCERRLIAWLLACLSNTSSAQGTTSSCRFSESLLARIDVADLGRDEFPRTVVRKSNGHYIVGAPGFGLPQVFDRTGVRIGAIGAAGVHGNDQGAVAVFLDRGDSIHVLDHELDRHAVYDPTFRFVRQNPIPKQFHTGVALAGGNVVVAARVGDPARIDKTFHLFDAVGNYKRSFTDDSTTIITPQQPTYTREPLHRCLT